MTEGEPKALTDVEVCERLSTQLNEQYKNGELPEVFKNETVEFQSTPHQNGWIIHWVFQGRRLDSAFVDCQKSSQWDETTWMEWVLETVANWIDAFKHPLVDNVEWQWVDDEQVKSDHSTLKWRDEVVFTHNDPLTKSAETLELVRGLAARLSARDDAKEPPVIIDHPVGIGSSPTESLNRLPLDRVGTIEMDRLFSDNLRMMTKLTLRHQQRMITVEFPDRAPPYSFSLRAWSLFSLGELLWELRRHLDRHGV